MPYNSDIHAIKVILQPKNNNQMKPNTALIKYKGQQIVNIMQLTGVYIDASIPWAVGYVIRFEFAGGQSTSWTFETREEVQSVYEKICSLFVTDLT